MPRRALRPNRSERDLKRRSTFDPTGLFKWNDGKQDGETSQQTPTRFAVSEDGGRPRASDVGSSPTPTGSGVGAGEMPPTPPIQDHTPNTRRFSMLRFRHASDSQLSLKAREQARERVEEEAPPVPQVPVASTPPAIITTAPTLNEHDEIAPPKRSRMPQFSLRRRSFDPNSTERPTTLRKSMDTKPVKHSMDVKRHAFSFMKSRDTLVEEPSRLSTTQQRPEAPGQQPARSASDTAQEGTSTLSLPVPRASESSRSDESSGGHISFEHNPRPRPAPKTGSARFHFGRRNKQRGSLFPLPPKVENSQFPNTAPATPRVSIGGVSSGSPPRRSLAGDNPTQIALNNARYPGVQNGTDTPPMPSPSQVALAAASMNLASPGASGLMRSDSTRSVRSSQSSPNQSPIRLALRGRSSTMGSLGGHSEHGPSPTPPYVASGRNSTSTAGRTSLSNLFGLGSKFRQNTDFHSGRHGSPAHGYLGSPGFTPLQNSVNISREALVAPEREEGETAGHYLERLEASNPDKSTIASFLSKNADDFSQAVLRSYMRKFAFYGDPLDMAIRKLLMYIELPKESQQIDRLLQRFADRYHECNPGIYTDPGKAHFIAFSIMMLHTDYFNPNNKKKMQRHEYIKNCDSVSISDDVLGCFYDNIVYTPFIRIEEDEDSKNKLSRKNKRTALLKAPFPDPEKKEPLDPYALLLQGKLDILRPNIKEVMNVDDPYTYLGTAPTLDIRTLYKSFARYGVIQIVSSRSRPEAFMSQNSQENPLDSSVGIVEMPVSKVGILYRKETKRQKARSPWQKWGAVLTRSGLSLFRKPDWAEKLVHQHDQHEKHGDGAPVVFQPPVPEFNPQTMIPMGGAVALVDNTYKKHKNAFVMLSKLGEEMFIADSEKDLNDWLGMLNYSAAFETLGVRPRGLIGGLYEGQRTRGIRRLESSHSTQSVSTPTGEVTIRSGKIDRQFAQQMMEKRQELMQVRISESEETLARSIKELEDRLRDARHMQILAPIQPKTRDAMIHAAGRLSARLKWTRQEIWRMKCHRDILAQELEHEKKSAEDRQARIEEIAETAQASSSQPQAIPQPTHKPSKLSGLARLSSKASSLTGHSLTGHSFSSHKPPLSPTTSLARPGTKSSETTDNGGEETFKTPPETRQASPNNPSGQFNTPNPFSPQQMSSHRRPSMNSSVAHSPRLAPIDHRPSVSSIGDVALSSDGASMRSHYTTPAHTEVALSEPRTPELGPTPGPRPEPESESEAERPAGLTGSPTSRTKVRRSLHRTLRDSHVGSSHSHRRSHKGRDSASTIVSDDTQESEGLARAHGSFTVHGKKASVITFGLDWHNMPTEERLKSIQPAAQDSDKNGSTEISNNDHQLERSNTSTSDSTFDLGSPPPITTESEEATPRQSHETSKQRHVSAQTITPASYQSSVNGPADGSDGGKSDMSEIAEETPKDLVEPTSSETTTNSAPITIDEDITDEKRTVTEESVATSPKPEAVKDVNEEKRAEEITSPKPQAVEA